MGSNPWPPHYKSDVPHTDSDELYDRIFAQSGKW